MPPLLATFYFSRLKPSKPRNDMLFDSYAFVHPRLVENPCWSNRQLLILPILSMSSAFSDCTQCIDVISRQGILFLAEA